LVVKFYQNILFMKL